jgi:hypothetical protein
MENKMCASSWRFTLVSLLEPILQQQNANISISDKLNSVIRLINGLEACNARLCTTRIGTSEAEGGEDGVVDRAGQDNIILPQPS